MGRDGVGWMDGWIRVEVESVGEGKMLVAMEGEEDGKNDLIRCGCGCDANECISSFLV